MENTGFGLDEITIINKNYFKNQFIPIKSRKKINTIFKKTWMTEN